MIFLHFKSIIFVIYFAALKWESYPLISSFFFFLFFPLRVIENSINELLLFINYCSILHQYFYIKMQLLFYLTSIFFLLRFLHHFVRTENYYIYFGLCHITVVAKFPYTPTILRARLRAKQFISIVIRFMSSPYF